MEKIKTLKIHHFAFLPAIFLVFVLLFSTHVFASFTPTKTPGEIIDATCSKEDVNCILKISIKIKITRIGESLSNISDNLASGWSTFTNQLLDNSINALSAHKQFADSLENNLTKGTLAYTNGILNIPNQAVRAFSSTKDLGLATTASVGDSLLGASNGISDGWGSFINTIIDNTKQSLTNTKDLAVSIWNNFTSIPGTLKNGVETFIATLNGPAPTTPQVTLPPSLVTTSITPKVVEQPTLPVPTPTPTKVVTPTRSITQNITQQQRDIIINQYDPSILPRIQGIELALQNSISHNTNQTDRTYDSILNSITSVSNSITEEGILNKTTLRTPRISNGTLSGTTIIGLVEAPGTLTINEPTTLNNNITQVGAYTFSTGSGAISLNGDVTLSANNSFTQNGTGSFSTGTGSNTLNGNTEVTGSNTFKVGTGLTTLGGDLTVTGTNWTTTPTISGLATLTSGLTSNGTVTIQNNSNFIQSGTGTFSTGTGAVLLDGNTEISGSNTFKVGTGTSTFGGNIIASTGGINIGTIGTPFGTIYSDSITANNIYGTIATGNTSSDSWIVNFDNATADTENSNIAFERGTVTPNALFSWDATNKAFTLNSELIISNTITTGPNSLTIPNDKTLAWKNSTNTGTTTFIKSTTADDLQFSTNGVSMTILSGGNTGIGTTNPRTKLELGGDGSLLATGSFGSGWTEPNLGAGTRMMWYPKKAAFRAGYVDGTQWDNANIGDYSIAIGNNTKASSSYSIALGFGTIANTWPGATAIGYYTTSSGYGSTAMGYYTIANAWYSTALGYHTTASSAYSTAMGYYTIASGESSTAMGRATTASSYDSFALGRYNVGGGTSDSWVSTDPLFEIGIGANSSNKANALTVLKNGNVGIGTAVPLSKLSINGGLHVGGDSDAGNDNILADGTITGTQLISNIVTGTSPFSVTSTTLNTNLNADLLDGQEGSYYAAASNISGTLNYVSKFTGTGSTIGNSQIFDNGTNVGIGTTAPASRLSLGADSYPDISHRIALWEDPDGTRFRGIGMANPTTGIYGVGIWTSKGAVVPTNTNMDMFIQDSGNVGIGTTEPDALLSLNKTTGYTNINFKMADVTKAQIGISDVVSDGIIVGMTAGDLGIRVQNNDLFVSTDGGSTAALVVKTTNGNVGIGTTNPGVKLELQGVGYSPGELLRLSGSSEPDNYYASFRESSGSGATIFSMGTRSGAVDYLETLTLKNGNVGIGTTDPLAKLSVQLDSSDGGSSANGVSFKTALLNGIAIGGNDTGNYSWIQSSGAKPMSLNPIGGNVGIGTTPSAWGSGFTVLQVKNSSIWSTGNDLSLTANAYYDGSNYKYIGSVGTSKMYQNTDGSISWATAASGTAGNNITFDTKMTLTQAGNVGIGTTNPTGKLTVVGPSGVTSFTGTSKLGIMVAGSTGNTEYNGIDFGQDSTYNNPAARIAVLPTGSGTYMSFGTSNGYSSGITNQAITIDPSGNVGIGTTGPTAALHVVGSGSVIARFNDTATNGGTISYQRSGTAILDIGTGLGLLGLGTNNDAAVYATSHMFLGADGNNVMTLNTGNVGIGTTGPTEKLEVAGGNIQIDGVSNTAASMLYLNNGSHRGYVGKENSVGNWVFGTTVPAYSLVISQYSETAPIILGHMNPEVTILNGGNVGIGTTPKTWDEWYNAMQIGAGGFMFGHDGVAEGAGFGSNVYISTGYKRTGVGQAALMDINGDFNFKTAVSGVADSAISWTNAMTILNGGNVGIGTTGPSSKLEITYANQTLTGAVTSDSIMSKVHLGLVTDTAQAADVGAALGLGGKYNNSGDRTLFGAIAGRKNTSGSSDDAGYLSLYTNSSGLTEKMRISSTGNVGIGTTGPLQKLDITGGSFRLDNTIGATPTGIVYKGASPFISDFNYGYNGTVTTLGNNTFVGIDAGNLTMGSTATSNYEASYNTAVGNGALHSNIKGYRNTANGYQSLYNNTTSWNNTANGYQSLYNNTTGSNNTANGYYSLNANTTGNYNTANGILSLYNNTTGFNNTANGGQSLYANATGNYNTANGYGALTNNTTGSHNTANGDFSLTFNTTGVNNTADGSQALYDLKILDGTGNNTALGYNTGRGIVTGINNTILGANVTGLAAGLSNNIIIADGSGNKRINVDNTGLISMPSLVSCGGIQTNGSGALSCTSDARLKDIKGNFTEGLDAIMKINPQTYSWKTDSGLYDGGINYSGFIAQNVETAIPEAVNINPSGNRQVNTTTILAASINAIKELNLKLEDISSLDITSATSLGSLIKQFLGDVGNGIGDFYANRVRTKQICVAKADGTEFCADGDKLQAMAENSTSSSSSSPTAEEIEAARVLKINTDLSNAKAAAESKVEADYTGASWSAFILAKEAALSLPEVVESQTPAELEANKIAKTTAITSAIAGLAPKTSTPTLSDISALTTAKATAQDLITANATESATPGNHIVGSLATLTAANASATGTTADTQAVIDAQVATLNDAIGAYNAAIVPAP